MLAKVLLSIMAVIKLSVERLIARGFAFDEPQDGHVNITNMPYYREDLPDGLGETNRMISWVVECVEEIIPADGISSSTEH